MKIHSALFLSVVAYCSVSLGVHAAEIKNAGFENRFNDWNEEDPSAVSSDAFRGKRSAKISGKQGLISQRVQVQANAHYILSAYVLGQGRIGATIAGDQKQENTIKKNQSWKKLSVDLYTGEQTEIEIYAAYHRGQGRFDEFSLTLKDSETSAIEPVNPNPNPISELCTVSDELVISKAKDDGSHDGHGPENAIDGDLSSESRWSSKGNGKTIDFDLGSISSITEIGTSWFKGNQRRSSFSIDTSIDGNTWSNVLANAQSSGTSTNIEYVDVADSRGRYVRLIGQKNSFNDWNSLIEMNIKGCDQNIIVPSDPVALSPMPTPVPDPMPIPGGAEYPAEVFDMNYWKITLPLDADNNGKVDEVDVKDMAKYQHPDFFFLDQNNHMVFQAPNKAATTVNSSNTRSELRQMLRGANTQLKTSGPGNNFVLSSHPSAEQYAAVGGSLTATLKINNVPKVAKSPNKSAYSVVVGQIHAGKDSKLQKQKQGFGWGNEPLKIFYKKLPNHKTGSVFWTYERNLPKKDKNRTDLVFPVWGNTWRDETDPGSTGIELGEEFSYSVSVVGRIMTLTFTSDRLPQVDYTVDLASDTDPNGQTDNKDNPLGYAGDWFYYKAGVYNQCSTKEKKGKWVGGCRGSGNWQKDLENGDYVSATFTALSVTSPQP